MPARYAQGSKFRLQYPGEEILGFWGWGFSSVVERLPSKRKALGSVPGSEKKEKKKKNPGFLYHDELVHTGVFSY